MNRPALQRSVKVTLIIYLIEKQNCLSFAQLVSGRNSTNPAIWLVPGAGGIFSSGPPQRVESVLLIYFRERISGNQFAGFVEFRPLTSWEKDKYMLLAGWQVRMGKNCDRGLENAFSSPRSQFFTIRTDLKPDNNMFIFFSWGKLAYKWVCLRRFV